MGILDERMEDLEIKHNSNQPFFCYYQNGFVLKIQDCCGCNKCGRLKIRD